MRSVMVHQFSNVPGPQVMRSTFDRSHAHKTTIGPQNLYPVYVDEVLPGDTFNMKTNVFARMQSNLVPVMDNLNIDIHYFFVPNRLVWANFKKFMGEQANPADSTSYVIPSMNAASVSTGQIGDYMGLPIYSGGAGPGMTVNELPFRAYNLIWNEWYRDENLQNSVTVATGDSGSLFASYQLLPRNKGHDYFTSSLPWPQKNNTGVSVDFLMGAPVVGDGSTNVDLVTSSGPTTRSLKAAMTTNNLWLDGAPLGADSDVRFSTTNTGLVLGSSTVGTINALRQAFQIQRLYERDARGGSRYTEIVRAHFGVVSPDARLQRPEYLGGGSVRVNAHPVAQTSATGLTGGSTAAGNLTAFSTAAGSGMGFTYSSTEHGYILGLCSMRVDLTYQNGLERFWSKSTRLDLYWPALSHIGEQAVLKQEIQFGNDNHDTDVWGYQERYAEYRYKPSRISGNFRSNATSGGVFDIYHYSQDYQISGGRISLNDTFIKQPITPLYRNIIVASGPMCFVDFYFKLVCARPMPVNSVPGLIDHF